MGLLCIQRQRSVVLRLVFQKNGLYNQPKLVSFSAWRKGFIGFGMIQEKHNLIVWATHTHLMLMRGWPFVGRQPACSWQQSNRDRVVFAFRSVCWPTVCPKIHLPEGEEGGWSGLRFSLKLFGLMITWTQPPEWNAINEDELKLKLFRVLLLLVLIAGKRIEAISWER